MWLIIFPLGGAGVPDGPRALGFRAHRARDIGPTSYEDRGHRALDSAPKGNVDSATKNNLKKPSSVSNLLCKHTSIMRTCRDMSPTLGQMMRKYCKPQGAKASDITRRLVQRG